MSILSRLIIAGLTFCLGLGLSLLPERSGPFVLSLAFFVLMPIASMSIVVYQGAYLKKAWRPAIGKAILAIFLWLFPSPIILVGTLVFWLDPFYFESSVPETIASRLWLCLWIGAYGVVGVRLCCWVNRYEAGGHWLLRSNQLQ